MQPNDILPSAHQNNAVEYTVEEIELDDMVLINPAGRVIEVPGALGQELLMTMGYRRASEKEASQLDEYKKRTHPEILRRAEIRRVREERNAVDALEAEIAGEERKHAEEPEKENDSEPEPAESPKPRSRK